MANPATNSAPFGWCVLAGSLALSALVLFGAHRASAPPVYEQRATHSPDGIGKFYCGREIARVMGHEGIEWLERGEREREERPDSLVRLLGLRPGERAADIGAGSGYYTRRLARAVGSEGVVFAVDIQPEMLTALDRRMAAEGLRNYRSVLGTESDPRLKEGTLDLALLVDVYHEFAFPQEMVAALCRALKPGGRLVFVEFRAEDPQVPIKALHKMSEAQVRREMAGHPLEWIRTAKELPWQHVIFFRKTP